MGVSGSGLFMAYHGQGRVRLPGEYRRVAYLSASSAPWIDTGLKADIDDTYEVQARALVSDSYGLNETTAVMGDGYNKTNSNFGLWFGKHPGKGVSANFGSGSQPYYVDYVSSVDVSVHHIYKLVLASAKLYMDGILLGQATPGTYPKSQRLVLFGIWRATSSSNRPMSCFNGNIRFFRARRRGVLLRDMIPVVRNSDDKPGMYDLCGSVCGLTETPFYVNHGTGNDFTWGELRA